MGEFVVGSAETAPLSLEGHDALHQGGDGLEGIGEILGPGRLFLFREKAAAQDDAH
jgi:hypothetical protein